MPAARERVELGDHPLEARPVLDARVLEALLPLLRQRRVRAPRVPGELEQAGEPLRAPSRAELPQPFAALGPPVRHGALDRPERAGVAARGELSEHGLVDPPLRLGDEVQEVVREIRIEPRRRVHQHLRRAIALDPDAVAALAGLLEVDAHRVLAYPRSALFNSRVRPEGPTRQAQARRAAPRITRRAGRARGPARSCAARAGRGTRAGARARG